MNDLDKKAVGFCYDMVASLARTPTTTTHNKQPNMVVLMRHDMREKRLIGRGQRRHSSFFAFFVGDSPPGVDWTPVRVCGSKESIILPANTYSTYVSDLRRKAKTLAGPRFGIFFLQRSGAIQQ